MRIMVKVGVGGGQLAIAIGVEVDGGLEVLDRKFDVALQGITAGFVIESI